jgi:uncharacterized protein YdgA (DUF945 family)
MKIKVRRYKQIEQMALTEAVEKVLLEDLKRGGEQLRKAMETLKAAGLDPEVLNQITKAVEAAAGAVATAQSITGEAE